MEVGVYCVSCIGTESVPGRSGEAGLGRVASVRDAEGLVRPAAAACRRQQTGRRDDGRH